MDLENKTIIITGASSGIGATAATVFARVGANLVLGARRSSELGRVTDEARRQGARAVAVPGDVTDPDYADALVRVARKDFGGLDGAFNNAGIVGDMLPASEMSVENWNDVIATNLTSAFMLRRLRFRHCCTGDEEQSCSLRHS